MYRYAYANNNPYTFVDPDGRDPMRAFAYQQFAEEVGGRVWTSINSGMFNTAGQALAADAAFIVGVATGDQALQDFAVEGMRENVSGDDGVAAATMLFGPRGGSRAGVPYSRPSNATTPAQRASVQGKPCVKCGAQTPTQVAGHKQALVKEHHETGGIDKVKMRSIDAVQPECPACSAREGAEMSRFSREMNKFLRDERQ